MKNLIALLQELEQREIKLSNTQKGVAIHQTIRNGIKAEILQAIKADIQAVYDYVYQNKDGILIEIANSTIANAIDCDEGGSGAMTVCVDVSVKGLDFNAEFEAQAYEVELETKAEKKRIEAEKKAKKIAEAQAKKGKS